MVTPRQFVKNLQNQIRRDRKTFILYSVLRVLVILTMIRGFLTRNYETVGVCVLALVLFLIPAFFERRFKAEIPPLFEGIIYLFIFAAEILGEINNFYVRIPGWDNGLHMLNGFLCAVIGFSLVDLLNRHSDHVELTPFYQTVAAFCFSMTIGVIWEFIEFILDRLLWLDSQKDYIVRNISSVSLDPSGKGALVRVPNIVQTVITTASGQVITIEGGYLDIGLYDTMKDLAINFAGAVIFCIIGYLYISHRSKQKWPGDLLIRPLEEEDTDS